MTKQHGSARAAVVAGRFVFMVEGLSVGRNLCPSRRRSSAQCDAKETAQMWRRGQRRPHRDRGGSPGLLPYDAGQAGRARSEGRKRSAYGNAECPQFRFADLHQTPVCAEQVRPSCPTTRLGRLYHSSVRGIAWACGGRITGVTGLQEHAGLSQVQHYRP